MTSTPTAAMISAAETPTERSGLTSRPASRKYIAVTTRR